MENNGLEESGSNVSVFNESFDVEQLVKQNNENDSSKDKEQNSENQKILRFEEKFLKRKRRELTEEEKKERLQKNISRYCKRNDEMLILFEKIDNGETTRKNINRMMRLLAIDLSETKKLINKKGLLYNQKKEIFNRLLNFTFEEYQYFWFKLTDGKYKKGKAQFIKSSNISKAKEILRELEEEKLKKEKEKENDINKNEENGNGDNNNINNEEENKKKDRTIKEIIQAANLRDNENIEIDMQLLGNDSMISESSSSSLEDSEEDDDENNSSSKLSKENNIKEDKEKEKKEKEEKDKKEQEEKAKKEKEEKLRKEKEERLKKEKEEKLRREQEERKRKEQEERLRKEQEEKLRKEEKEKREKILKGDEDEIDIFN